MTTAHMAPLAQVSAPDTEAMNVQLTRAADHVEIVGEDNQEPFSLNAAERVCIHA